IHPFNGKNPPGNEGKNRGLIAASRAYLKHLLRPGKFKRLGHIGHHEGLRYRLPSPYRKRIIAVCLRNKTFINKEVARHGKHCVNNLFLPYAAGDDLGLNHGFAGPRVDIFFRLGQFRISSTAIRLWPNSWYGPDAPALWICSPWIWRQNQCPLPPPISACCPLSSNTFYPAGQPSQKQRPRRRVCPAW